MRYRAIVAIADGLGFAYRMSFLFETPRRIVNNLNAEMLLYPKERFTNPERKLRLVTDEVPMTAQIVNINGQPV